MGKFLTQSGNYLFHNYTHPVHVRLCANAKSIRARWKAGALVMSAPMGISYDSVQAALNNFLPTLMQRKPQSPFFAGQTVSLEDFTVKITRLSHDPQQMRVSYKQRECAIEVGDDREFDSPVTIRQISRLIGGLAKKLAPDVLLPLAREIAEEVGQKPMLWTISAGHRVLGHCNVKGEIALSHCLLYYPTELRRYVICHELAHLTEMNHSPRFHEICDRYCGGHARRLEAALRAYKSPIP